MSDSDESEKEIYEIDNCYKIPRFSWALWNTQGENDAQFFNQNSNKLHSKVILLSRNESNKLTIKENSIPYINCHSKNKNSLELNHKDKQLKQFIQDDNLENIIGGYITDLLVVSPTPIKNSTEVFKDELKKLNKKYELRIIICFGDSTFNLLCEQLNINDEEKIDKNIRKIETIIEDEIWIIYRVWRQNWGKFKYKNDELKEQLIFINKEINNLKDDAIIEKYYLNPVPSYPEALYLTSLIKNSNHERGHLQYKIKVDILKKVVIDNKESNEWTIEENNLENLKRLLPQTKTAGDIKEYKLILVIKRNENNIITLKGALLNIVTNQIALMTTFNNKQYIIDNGSRFINSYDSEWFIGWYRMAAPNKFWYELINRLNVDKSEEKHDWTEEETRIICEMYKNNKTIDETKEKLPQLKLTSIKMKYSNCIYLDKGEIKGSLKGVSKMHEKIWNELNETKEINLIDIENDEEYINEIKNSKNVCEEKIDEELDNEKKVHYIYLIQLREWFTQNKNIYKFGRATQVVDRRINRFEQYPKGSKVLLLIEIESDPVEIENKIRKEFRKKFKKHTDGHEHFIGDSDEMIDIIYKIVNDDKKKKNIKKLNEKIDPKQKEI
jgi:hypothetical protein